MVSQCVNNKKSGWRDVSICTISIYTDNQLCGGFVDELYTWSLKTLRLHQMVTDGDAQFNREKSNKILKRFRSLTVKTM